jgi:hypothetical protein
MFGSDAVAGTWDLSKWECRGRCNHWRLRCTQLRCMLCGKTEQTCVRVAGLRSLVRALKESDIRPINRCGFPQISQSAQKCRRPTVRTAAVESPGHTTAMLHAARTKVVVAGSMRKNTFPTCGGPGQINWLDASTPPTCIVHANN